MFKHDVLKDRYLRVHAGYAFGSSHAVAKRVSCRLKPLQLPGAFNGCAYLMSVDLDRVDKMEVLNEQTPPDEELRAKGRSPKRLG